MTDPAGNQVSFAYSPAGDLTSATDQNGGVTSFAYDSSHHITSVTDPGGHTSANNTYDGQESSSSDRRRWQAHYLRLRRYKPQNHHDPADGPERLFKERSHGLLLRFLLPPGKGDRPLRQGHPPHLRRGGEPRHGNRQKRHGHQTDLRCQRQHYRYLQGLRRSRAGAHQLHV